MGLPSVGLPSVACPEPAERLERLVSDCESASAAGSERRERLVRAGVLLAPPLTSGDFDGRLHTYAIGIKLPPGSNLQVCTSLAPSWRNYTGIKLAKLAIPVSEKDQVCSPVIGALGGYSGWEPSYIYEGFEPSYPPKRQSDSLQSMTFSDTEIASFASLTPV